MEEKHTKGPWKTSCHRETWSPNRWTIREHEFHRYPYEGQLEREWGVYPPLGEVGPVALVAGEANARLIAAAPELLEAARLILAFGEQVRFGEEIQVSAELIGAIRAAHAAIAKAEARS